MKKVNLEFYLTLAEHLQNAKTRCGQQIRQKGSDVYFPLVQLTTTLRDFVTSDNGFVASKHAARELVDAADRIKKSIFNWEGSGSDNNIERLNEDLEPWSFNFIVAPVDKFRNSLSAECNEVDVYSVGAISIYSTSALVSRASERIPATYRAHLDAGTVAEFDQAGRCLAFGLPTGCGFHALRGLELVMAMALNSYGWKKRKPQNWDQYVKAFDEISASGVSPSPSPKVSAMIDRMRQIDRNPIMHPEDTLDETSAEMLFSLCAITCGELVKDLLQQSLLPLPTV